MSAGTTDPLELLSVAELAELWKLSPTTVRKFVASGELASVQLGSRRLVPRIAAEEFMRAHSSDGRGPQSQK
jgi:excisionase family DNA binding protein